MRRMKLCASGWKTTLTRCPKAVRGERSRGSRLLVTYLLTFTLYSRRREIEGEMTRGQTHRASSDTLQQIQFLLVTVL